MTQKEINTILTEMSYLTYCMQFYDKDIQKEMAVAIKNLSEIVKSQKVKK